MDLDVGESGQGVLGCLQGMKCLLRRGRDVNIVEECIQSLTRAQLRMEVEEGGVLAERVKPGHQRISFFTPLLLSLALVIAEYVTAGLAIKQAGEGQQACQLGVAAQGTEHACTGDVIERANPVDAQQRGAWVSFRRRAECSHQRFRPCSRAERIFKSDGKFMQCKSSLVYVGRPWRSTC